MDLILQVTNGTEGVNETTSFQRLYYISPEHFDDMFIDLASRSVLKLKNLQNEAQSRSLQQRCYKKNTHYIVCSL